MLRQPSIWILRRTPESEGPMLKFAKLFRSLPDPRAPNALHELRDILVIALAAVLCGAKCATDMELFFCRSKGELLRQFLRLENAIPSHDTFSRAFGQKIETATR